MEKRDNYLLHIVLFLCSWFTTTLAGAEWVNSLSPDFSTWGEEGLSGFLSRLSNGLPYSICFLAFLTFHEFGHYFAALYHRVRCSLPFYIPFYLPLMGINIGSMGAIIRLRESPASNIRFFDIGIAGPLAGFVVSVCVLSWGLTHLPDPGAYIHQMHPEYVKEFGGIPTPEQLLARHPDAIIPQVGSNLLFEFLKWVWVKDPAQLPPAYEMMHYPFLLVGFLTLFFTALNLLPIGQLDGGHVTFGLLGHLRSAWLSRITVVVLMITGGMGLLHREEADTWFFFRTGGFLIYFLWVASKLFTRLPLRILIPGVMSIVAVMLLINWLAGPFQGVFIWLFYSFMTVRFLGIDHPPVVENRPLGTTRKILGWIAILIFILSFSPNPLTLN